MNQHEINNYLSFKKQYKNKYEDACPLFYGDFALVDGGMRILAARGLTLCEGNVLALTDTNRRFLMKTLSESQRVVLRQRSGLFLIFGELLPAGLYAVLIPHGDKNEVAGAMAYLSQMQPLILAPAVRKLVREESSTAETCMAAEEETAQIDGILHPEPGLSLAELCERVASYAGCHIQIDRSMPADAEPPAGHDRIRLTGFLLCAFLILRKHEPDGLTVSLLRDGRVWRMTVRSVFPLSEEMREEVCNGLKHPAFADFELEWA